MQQEDVAPPCLSPELEAGGDRARVRGEHRDHRIEATGGAGTQGDGADLRAEVAQMPVQVEGPQRRVREVGASQDRKDPKAGNVVGECRGGQLRRASTSERASSSLTSRAKLSSETSTLRALTNIDFSPAESPLAWSRSDRFRTTSATW